MLFFGIDTKGDHSFISPLFFFYYSKKYSKFKAPNGQKMKFYVRFLNISLIFPLFRAKLTI